MENLAKIATEPGQTHLVGIQRHDLKQILAGGTITSTFTYQDKQYTAVFRLDTARMPRRMVRVLRGLMKLNCSASRDMWKKLKRGSSTLVNKFRIKDGTPLYINAVNMKSYKAWEEQQTVLSKEKRIKSK